MAIKIKCRKCEAKFSVKDAAAGRRVKCRECGAPIKVPVPKTDEDELLDFDTAAYGDDPSGDDPYGDDVSTATQPLPRRRRKTSGNKRSASSGGKKSSGSNRGLIIGLSAGGGCLSAGGGLLVIALLALAFWPEKPSSEVADAVAATQDASPKSQADAVAAIKNLGGRVTLDKTSREVVAVNLSGTPITDAGLEHLQGMTNRQSSASTARTSRMPGWST